LQGENDCTTAGTSGSLQWIGLDSGDHGRIRHSCDRSGGRRFACETPSPG
jgi:hypothetical protein